MKLLFVVSEFGPDVTGGIATYYRHLLPELARQGHTVQVVLADSGSGPPPKPISNVTVARVDAKLVDAELHRFDALAAVPDLQRRMARALAAYRLIDEGQGFDVVETSDYRTLFAPWLAVATRVPVVVQLHGSDGQLGDHDRLAGDEFQACIAQLVETSLLRHADELQSYGCPNAREWAGKLGREVVHLWPAWRSAGEPAPASLPGGIEGLVVGRVQSWKGPHVLCEALRLLGSDAPTIGWVGSDTNFHRRDRWTSEHLATTYPDVWGRKVVPLGRRDPAETASLQAAARFVVVPSTWDVFNLAAVEAMGHGRVVICSEGAGAAELIRDGETGFRTPAGDAKALAERLSRARSLSEVERRRMGEAARSTVAVELDPSKIAGRRGARYEALAKGRSKIERKDLTSLIGLGETIDEPLALLDQLPLRRLVRYTLRRGVERILKMLGQ